jgi:hypothetical protein
VRKLLITVALLGTASGHTASAQTSAPKPWDAEVRCAALSERMPEVMDFTLKIVRAAATLSPEARAQLPGLEKAMVEARPALAQAQMMFRASAKEAVSKSANASDGPVDRVLERELDAARREYARYRFTEVTDTTEAEMKAFQAEFKARCTPSQAAS